MKERLRELPQIQRLLESEPALLLVHQYGHETVAEAIRTGLSELRASISENSYPADAPIPHAGFFKDIELRLSGSRNPTLRRVINATGILVHTNLGRARLAPEAIAAVQDVAANYATLELNLEDGKRGSRQDHVEAQLCELTGAEAALVVNNCAAAVLLVLTALARGRQVLASRGELVEIGGAFRMPDIIAQSGASLKEVGTTNKTRLNDYQDAISEETALILKSHTSNYKIVGFTSSPGRGELAALAKREGIVLVEDLGSGVLVDLAPYGLTDEPVVRDVLASGVDLVTFSGDKLLGGPQAGIIAGKRALIDQIKTHPMARAVRIDKLSLAALCATLELYRAPNDPLDRIPVLKALSDSIDIVRARAVDLKDRIGAADRLDIRIVDTIARAGAGSLPQQDLQSCALEFECASHSAGELAQRIRAASTPVIGRISQDRFLLDVRTIAPDELGLVAAAVGSAISA